jgi:GT2 family glycosyltransferase
MGVPRVTTVVVTRDRRSELERSLPHHQSPVVLVDNGSSDGSVEMVRERFPLVYVVELARNEAAVARNIGVEAAPTAYVAFADDDSWWAPGALDRAADLLDASPRVGLVAGRILVGEEERLDPASATMAASPLRPPDLPGPAVRGFVACGSVVRRSAFRAAGGFDPVVRFPGEEARLAYDLAAYGWELVYADDVVAHHHPSSLRPPSEARVAAETRSALLTCLMRRPWPVVVRECAATARSRVGRRGVATALPAVPAALMARRRLPSRVERELRRIEAQKEG